jgi:glutathione S-transferase
MLKLYGYPLSGNSYKVALMLSLLGVEYESVSINVVAGEHRQPEFLMLNPFGQIPVVRDGDILLSDAQAILVYLARQYGGEEAERWLPSDPLAMAQVLRWLSVAAGEVRQGPEFARLYHLFGVSTINIERASDRAAFILAQLNRQLTGRDWLACEGDEGALKNRLTIADVAVFPYVALAPDGKIDLDPYPYVLAWIERIKQLPNFVGMAGIR